MLDSVKTKIVSLKGEFLFVGLIFLGYFLMSISVPLGFPFGFLSFILGFGLFLWSLVTLTIRFVGFVDKSGLVDKYKAWIFRTTIEDIKRKKNRGHYW